MSTIAISGANRGIGLALTKLLVKREEQVFALCRSSSSELDALPVEVISGIDVAQASSLHGLTDKLPPIDVVINNAGVLYRDSLQDWSEEDILQQFQVNALGPLRLTRALLPNLRAGGKIAIVTSRMGSIADNGSGRMYGYRMSKAAVNMAGMSLAQDLKSKKIAVTLLHPGYVRTDMTGGNGFIDTETSAQGLLKQIDRLTLEQTGSFWHMNGELLPW